MVKFDVKSRLSTPNSIGSDELTLLRGVKHFAEFEYYYSLGVNRSLNDVADKFGINRNSLGRMCSRERWGDLVMLWDSLVKENCRQFVIDTASDRVMSLSNLNKKLIKKLDELADELLSVKGDPTSLLKSIDALTELTSKNASNVHNILGIESFIDVESTLADVESGSVTINLNTLTKEEVDGK